MTKQSKRTLTPADIELIAEKWRAFRAYRQLRDHALPPTSEGAWIYEAATLQMATIAAELEALFATTLPSLPEDPSGLEGSTPLEP